MTVTWLHLSDLHACERDHWSARRVTETLIADLEHLKESENLVPDFLFFTGDAAFGHLGNGPGETLEDQFGLFEEFLHRVCAVWALPKENVFLVPGNHDVQRTKVPQTLESFLKSTTDLAAVQGLIARADGEWQLIMDRLEEYRKFLGSAGFDHLLTDPDRLIYATTRNAGGLAVGISGFNSAWSCSKSGERGHLWMAGRWQQENLRPALEQAELKIALMHHPTSWLVEQESPDFGRELRQDYQFLLHGHEHTGWVEVNDRGFVQIAAAACYQRADPTKIGYNFVRLEPASGTAEVWLRKYDPSGGGWVPRAIPRQTSDDGVRPLRLDVLRHLGEPRTTRRRQRSEGGLPTVVRQRPVQDERIIHYLQRLRARHRLLPRPGARGWLPVAVDVENSYVPQRAEVLAGGAASVATAALPAIDPEKGIQLARSEFRRNGVVVRGEQGSGKTTFLKKLVLTLTDEMTAPQDLGLPRDVVPVMIELHSVEQPQKGLQHAIVKAIQDSDTALGDDSEGARKLARHLLRSDHLLLLVDGLDEVIGYENRKAVASWIEEEARGHSDWTFVVTSGYQDSQAASGLGNHFLELRLRSLEEGQVEEVIRRWTREIARDSVPRSMWSEADERAKIESEDLLRGLFDDAGGHRLRPLTTNFLTLQTLSQVHRRLGELPEQPVVLYAECVEALLDLWREKKRLPRSHDPSNALRLLRPLAESRDDADTDPMDRPLPSPTAKDGSGLGRRRPPEADPGATARERSSERTGERLNPKDGSVLLWVPAGVYIQGSEDLSIDERPEHPVQLEGFWFSKYPITNEQFRAFLEANPRQPEPAFWTDATYNQPHQPVVGVSWHQARAYCEWAGLELPSEAQWEAAARGTDGRPYPWGTDPPGTSLANFSRNVGRTSPVDAYPDGVGPFGTFDQSGNVWEWCEDVWDGTNYRGRQVDPRTGRPARFGGDGNPARCIRGGAWWEEPWKLNAAYRTWCDADTRELDLGFRCVQRADFRGSVLRYDDPTEPVGVDDWEALR